MNTPLDPTSSQTDMPLSHDSSVSPINILNTEAALHADAEVYAADQGIDLNEAIQRLKLQTVIGDLDASLQTNEPDTFAGLWIQHRPEYRVVVAFTVYGEETIRKYVEGGLLSDFIEIRTASATLVQLRDAQSSAIHTLRKLGIEFDSEINVFNNQVEICATDPELVHVTLYEADETLPELVVVVKVEELSRPT